MPSYSECVKKLGGSFDAVDKRAQELLSTTNLDEATAYTHAANQLRDSLELEKQAFIKDTLKETGDVAKRSGLGAEKVAPTPPVTPKKAPKKKVTAPVEPRKVRKPTKKAADKLKAKIQATKKVEDEKPVPLSAKESESLATEIKIKKAPIEEPTASFTVKNKAAATRALQMANLTGQHVSKKNLDGTYDITIDTKFEAPEGTLNREQDFDGPVGAVIAQAAKVFDVGRAQKGFINFRDNNKAKSPNARVNLHELVQLGALISGKPITFTKNLSKQIRDNLAAGQAFLLTKGYSLDKEIPSDKIVFEAGKVTLGSLDKVSKEIEKISQRLYALEAIRDSGRLYSPENSEKLREYHALRDKLGQYDIGVQGVQDTSFDKADIEEISGEGIETITTTFADLVPEYQAPAPSKFRETSLKQVSSIGKTVSDKETTYAEKLLKHLGITPRVVMVDETGVLEMIQELGKKKTPATEAMTKNLERILIDRPKGRILYNDESARATERTPVIFVSEKETKIVDRFKIITHELGHLVQRTMLDTAPTPVQKLLRDAAGDMESQAFQEWFTNQLVYWSMNREVPKSLIEKFFRDMGRILHKLWAKATQSGKELNETFQAFMDAMVSAEGQRSEKKSVMRTKIGKDLEKMFMFKPATGAYMPRSGMNQYSDFTPMTPKLRELIKDMKARYKRASVDNRAVRITDNTIKTFGETFLALHDAIIRSANARLIAMKTPTTDWIAKQWHHVPGTKREPGQRTIPTEMQQRGARWHDEIIRISQKIMPRKYGKVIDTVFGFEVGRLDKSSIAYSEIGRILIDEVSLLEKDSKGDYTVHTPLSVKLREEHGDVLGKEIEDGWVATRVYLDNLYTYLTEELGLAIKKRKNYYPHTLDITAITNDKDEFIQILKENGVAKGPDQDTRLEEFYQQLAMSDGTVMDLEGIDPKGDVLGPSFQGLRGRVFSPELIRKLNKFYINDTMSTLTAYTHSAVKRGVIQKRFNPDNVLSSTGRGYSTFDPLYKLNMKLDEAAKLHSEGREGGLSPVEIGKVKETVEAYLGRLGAGMNPKLRNMSALMVTYQNMRLLSFVVLSSLVDAGLIGVRGGNPMIPLIELFKVMSDKGHKQQLYDAAYMIGAIRDDITEHVVNDQQAMTYMSNRLKAGNEAFFRLVRMHQWTNLSRVMALSAGKTFLNKHADSKSKKSQRYLTELGVTAQEIKDWGGDFTNIPENINTALHQFIDESVIRPSAAIRPTWASDPHWAIFFHLKQFMWGYHEVILRRLWNETKNNEGLMKAVPIALLATATLPLAATGYELRRWIGGAPEYSDKHGADYFWEVIQRSGGPGILQLYIDADEAEEFGQFAPMALMGPTATQVSDFLTKDFDQAMSKSIPFVAQMPAVRSWLFPR